MAEHTTASETVVRGRISNAGVDWVSLETRCSACDFVSFAAALVAVVDARGSWIADHDRQHDPDRAINIEVDWTPSAHCSVCVYGVGDISVFESKCLRGSECGTFLEIDGTWGERDEEH